MQTGLALNSVLLKGILQEPSKEGVMREAVPKFRILSNRLDLCKYKKAWSERRLL